MVTEELLKDLETYLTREYRVLHTMCLEADVAKGTQRRRKETWQLLLRIRKELK